MYTKIIQSGKTIEIYEYEKIPAILNNKNQYGTNKEFNQLQRLRRKKKNRSIPLKTTARRKDNVRRAKRNFIRLIWANTSSDNKPILLTLTMLSVLPLKASSSLFTSFLNRCRRRYGKKFKCIAVPEFQDRGAVHFHCLLWDLPNEIQQEEATTRNLQRLWLYGFCDCTQTDGRRNLAGYLAKYFTQTMYDLRLRNQKAYYSTRNIVRTMSTGTSSFSTYRDEIIDDKWQIERSSKFTTQWLGDCKYNRYVKE